MKVGYSKPDITEADIAEVIHILQSGSIFTGKKVKQLEESIALYCGTSSAICTQSFTEGIEKILRLLEIGPGDEVLLPAYMHPAAAIAVQRVGARVMLTDTAPGSYTVSAEQLNDALTIRTKAVILSNIGGVMCDYDQVRQALHQKRHLFEPQNEIQAALNRVALISDASDSFGSTHDLYKSGQSADFTCFSFHSTAGPYAGNGAAIVWRDIIGLPLDELVRKSAAAQDSLNYPLDDSHPFTDISSSIILTQLSRVDETNQKRREIIQQYDELLYPSWVDSLRHKGANFLSNGGIYMARVPGMSEAERDAMAQELASAGIETKVHFKPLPMLPNFQKMGYLIQSFPNAYKQYENEISLPLYVGITDKAIAYVVDLLKRCVHRGGFVAC